MQFTMSISNLLNPAPPNLSFSDQTAPQPAISNIEFTARSTIPAVTPENPARIFREARQSNPSQTITTQVFQEQIALSSPQTSVTSPTITHSSEKRGKQNDAKENQPGKKKSKVRDSSKDSFIYQGEVLNGLPHGKGKITYKNGSAYEGEFAKGDIHGKGKKIYSNGLVYEGEFINGTPCGKGRLIHQNGTVFECSFPNP
jgi:hypothetical protein